MYTAILRNNGVFLGWAAIWLCAALVQGVVFWANYMGLSEAFSKLGFDMMPLGKDPLFGPLVGAFLGKATLVQVYASCVAGAIGFGIFMMMKLGFRVLDLTQERQTLTEENNPAKARTASRLINRNAIYMAILGIPLLVAIFYDVSLFKYRSIVSLLHPGGVDIDPMGIPQMASMSRDHPDSFATWLAGMGAWGYIAITMIACLVFELVGRKVGEAWSWMLASYGSIFRSTSPNGQNTIGTGTEQQSARRIPDTQGGNEPIVAATVPATEANKNPVSSTTGTLMESVSTGNATSDGTSTNEASPIPQQVVGAAGISISLEDARSQPDRFHVDLQNVVWDRKVWDSLHQPGGPQLAAAGQSKGGN